MPLAELIEKAEKDGITVTPAQAEKRLKKAGLDPSGDLPEEAIAHLQTPTEKDQPKNEAAQLTKSRKERQAEGKGSLTKANQQLGNAAIAANQKQFAALADTAAVEGVITYADRLSKNYGLIADQIALSGDLAVALIDTVDAEFALGGDEEGSPLELMPASEFSLL